MNTYDFYLQHTKDKLDEIDISVYLKRYTDISDIMFEMSGDYEQKLANDDILSGDLFKFMT